MQRRQTFCDKEKTQAWDEFQDLAWWGCEGNDGFIVTLTPSYAGLQCIGDESGDILRHTQLSLLYI